MSTTENRWDEQELADLVGLQLQDPDTPPDTEPETPTVSEPLLDPEDMADAEAQGKKDRALATNPFAKLGVVAAGTGLVIGVVAVFTSGVMNNDDSSPAGSTQAESTEEGEEEVFAEDDRGQLLTDLAMGRQQADLEALADESTSAEAPETIDAPEFSPPPQPKPQPPQPVAQRPVPATPRIASPTRVAPAAPPRSEASAEPKVDPMEQWMTLSQIGSYGQGSNNAFDQETTLAQPAEDDFSSSPVQLVQASAPSPFPEVNHAEEAAILQGQPIRSRSISTGTQANAVLETPLIWADGLEADSPQFVVQLTEPLLTPDKEIGLPAETQLVAQVQSVNDGGFVQLSVVSIIRDGQEMALPEGAVQLRGAEGSPLIARKYGDPGMAIANMDLNIALTAGLSRAAELINRPRSSSVITSTGGSAVTQETDDPNLLAGVMEGAFGALTEQIAERNQAALEEILERPVIWYLEPGTEVDVFINQTVAL